MNTIRQNFGSIASEAVKEVYRLMNGSDGQEIVLPYSIERLQYLDIIC